MDALNEPRKNHHNFRTPTTRDAMSGREEARPRVGTLSFVAQIECGRGERCRGGEARVGGSRAVSPGGNALLKINDYEGAISATHITTSVSVSTSASMISVRQNVSSE